MPRPLQSSRFPRTAALLALLCLLACAGPVAAGRLAVAPVQDRAGDPELAAAVEAEVRGALAAGHELVDPTELRDALRRGRIRSVDHATADDLRAVAQETGADRVVSVTLHQALRAEPPRVSVSARVWDATSGAMDWAGFEARSGLDGRTVLGLGVVHDPVRVAARVGRELATGLSAGVAPGNAHRDRPDSLGPVALVPLDAVTDHDATNAAETGTEIVRAVLHRNGVDVAPVGCVAGSLRRQTFYTWGSVTAPARRAVAARCGVRWVLTGTVEAFDVSVSALEPDPRVGIALRLLDAETGRIVWTGALEREGHDSEVAFRLGRVRTRAGLGERLVKILIRRLLDEVAAGTPTERT